MNDRLLRKLIHVAAGFLVLLIGRVQTAYLLVSVLLFFAASLLYSCFHKKQSLGLLAYPFSVGLLMLIFYEKPAFALIGWSAMAFGGGFTRILAKYWGGTKFTWNNRKSVEGYLVFNVFGIGLTVLFLYFAPFSLLMGLNLSVWSVIVIISVLLSGLLESLKGTIHDNIIVPITTALLSCGLFNAWQGGNFELDASFRWAVPIITIFALLTIISKKMDFAGAFSGWLLAICIYLGAGFEGLSLLLTFFVGSMLATQWKMEEKRTLELAEKNRGQRSLSNVISNGSLAAILGLLAWVFPANHQLCGLLLAVAISAATADTFSSEIGNIAGKQHYNILTFRKGKRGEDGMVSLEGTLAGAFGGLLITFNYALVFDDSLFAFFAIWAGGMIGTLSDSLMGATLQRKGLLTNHTVNFLNTLCAVGLIAALATW